MATLVPFLFFTLFASPSAFKLTRQIAGSWIANAEGLATFPGLVLHALVFVLVVGFFMRRASRYVVPGFPTADETDDANNKKYQGNRFVN